MNTNLSSLFFSQVSTPKKSIADIPTKAITLTNSEETFSILRKKKESAEKSVKPNESFSFFLSQQDSSHKSNANNKSVTFGDMIDHSRKKLDFDDCTTNTKSGGFGSFVESLLIDNKGYKTPKKPTNELNKPIKSEKLKPLEKYEPIKKIANSLDDEGLILNGSDDPINKKLTPSSQNLYLSSSQKDQTIKEKIDHVDQFKVKDDSDVFNMKFLSKSNFEKNSSCLSSLQAKEKKEETLKPKKTFAAMFGSSINQYNVTAIAQIAKEEARNSFEKSSKKKEKKRQERSHKKRTEEKSFSLLPDSDLILSQKERALFFDEEADDSQEEQPSTHKNVNSNKSFKHKFNNKSSDYDSSSLSSLSNKDQENRSNTSFDFNDQFEEDKFAKKRRGKKSKMESEAKMSKLKGKLSWKTQKKRELKEKAIKDYLAETRFHYSSKPLPYVKLADRKSKTDPPELKISSVPEFMDNTGIKIKSLLETTKPYDFFKVFLPDSIFDEIARLTNIYASIEFHKTEAHKNREWREVETHEIKKFLALLFLFGIVRKYSVNEYWTSDPLLGLSSVRKIMNKHRFNEIRRYLCFYDRRKKKDFERVYPPLDPFYKCRFLIDHIVEICPKVYTPERDLSVDESMIAFMGIHRLKVYMPRKPTKWGFKAFVLAEASSGYVLNMILNEGHKRGENEDLLSKRIVLQILQGYEGKGYRVYMDRWYTSADLLEEMKRRAIGGCGTIFLSRVGLVNDLKKEVRQFLDPGEASFYTNGNLIFCCWYQYRRQVYVLSNLHNAEWVKVEKVRKVSYFCKKEYKIYEYNAPRMIKEYTMHMKGVDLFNQRVSYYSVDYNIMKWYVRIVFFLTEIAMVNSYLIYCKSLRARNMKTLLAADFRMEVIKNLINWEIDITKPSVLTKAQLKEGKYDENDELENEFNGITLKRKAEKDLKDVVIKDLNVKFDCKLEYIGIKGICLRCKTTRKKIKITNFWCKACKKGICPNCFDKHKAGVIFEKLANDENVFPLIENLINRKKVKILETTEYYEEHILGPQKAKQRKRNFIKAKGGNNFSLSENINNFSEIRGETSGLNFSQIEELKEIYDINDDFSKMKKTLELLDPEKTNEKELINKLDSILKEEKESKKDEKESLNILEKINENKEMENSKDENLKTDDKLGTENKKNNELIVDDLKSVSKVEKPQKKRIELLKQLIQEIDHEKHNQEDLKKLRTMAKNIVKKNSNLSEIRTETSKNTNVEPRLVGRHFPSTNPFGKQVNCEVCKKTTFKRTIGYCSVCKVSLCPIYCFEKYHTTKDIGNKK